MIDDVGLGGTAPRLVGRRQLIAGAGVAVMAAGLVACDSGDDAESAVTNSAPETAGPTSATIAPRPTTGAAPSTSASAGGAEKSERAIQLFATPLQNQFAAWAFEYVAEGADVGEIEAIANDMASDDDGAYYDAWYLHATRH